MRIVLVTEAFPYGAGEAFLIPEVSKLVELHHEILIVPLIARRELVHQDAAAFVPYTLQKKRFEWRYLVDVLLWLVGRPAATVRIWKWLIESRSTKVLLRNVRVFPKGFWLAQRIRRWKADHIHAHFAVSSASIAMVASELTGVDWSVTTHRYDIVENDLLELKMMNARSVRFISQSTLRLARGIGVRVDRGNVRVLHMGVRMPEARSQRGDGMRRAQPTVLCPASLVPVKGHGYLLEAMAILAARRSGVRLLLAGSGCLREELEERITDLKLTDRVRMLGQLSHHAVLELYENQRVDMVVLPSIALGGGVEEGVPVALLEAMSFGVPVVATNTGGIPDLLSGGAGVVVPAGDARALADAMEGVLGNEGRWSESSRRGVAKIRKEYWVEQIVEDWLREVTRQGTKRGELV